MRGPSECRRWRKGARSLLKSFVRSLFIFRRLFSNKFSIPSRENRADFNVFNGRDVPNGKRLPTRRRFPVIIRRTAVSSRSPAAPFAQRFPTRLDALCRRRRRSLKPLKLLKLSLPQPFRSLRPFFNDFFDKNRSQRVAIRPNPRYNMKQVDVAALFLLLCDAVLSILLMRVDRRRFPALLRQERVSNATQFLCRPRARFPRRRDFRRPDARPVRVRARRRPRRSARSVRRGFSSRGAQNAVDRQLKTDRARDAQLRRHA